MVLDASGMTAVCHYCGTRYTLNHEDTDYYHRFFLRMRGFLSASESEQERKNKAEAFWEKARQQSFECADGKTIEIKYMHRYTDKDAEIYVARRNIIFHFSASKAKYAEAFRRNVSFIDYPSADTRSLSDFFPKVNGGYVLEDGSSILVINKDEDEYPLRIFGALHPKHVAWIISRMENLCCVLEYNGIVHPEINVDTLYINPYTHQASLYGNWWKTGKNNDFNYTKSGILKMQDNLIGLRNTAAVLLGFEKAGRVKSSKVIPSALADFINKPPKTNAYEDFECWDKALIDAFGKREFTAFETSDEDIYNNQR